MFMTKGILHCDTSANQQGLTMPWNYTQNIASKEPSCPKFLIGHPFFSSLDFRLRGYDKKRTDDHVTEV
jgi:hypothetical protein